MKEYLPSAARPLVFTWHIHGSYLYYLSKADIDIVLPVTDPVREGYHGRGRTFPFGDNVHEVPAHKVHEMDFDCILFQSPQNFQHDQYEILSDQQRQLPSIYLEHNAPTAAAVDAVHPMNDPATWLVHVTYYNKLMWHNSVPQVHVIEHGITSCSPRYAGTLNRGVVVINHIRERGRVTGWDIFEEVRKELPIDLAGMGTEKYGGLGEILHPYLPAFLSRYRFFFNPIRYTSLGLSMLEAMMVGLPVVAISTTEYSTVIRHGESGFIHTDLNELIKGMQQLLHDQQLAGRMGKKAQQTARQRFSIGRFARDWESLIHAAIHQKNNTHEKENSIHQ